MKKIELRECINLRGKTLDIEYYSTTTPLGGKKYFALIALENVDKVILDNTSLFTLRAIVDILCPLLVESRSVSNV